MLHSRRLGNFGNNEPIERSCKDIATFDWCGAPETKERLFGSSAPIVFTSSDRCHLEFVAAVLFPANEAIF